MSTFIFILIFSTIVPIQFAGFVALQNSRPRSSEAFSMANGTLPQTYVSPNAQAGGVFGRVFALNGNLLIVGAVGESVDGHPNAGRVYIFNVTSQSLIRTLISPHVQSPGYFGRWVASRGNLLVVGAPLEDAKGVVQAGRAYIFNVETGALIHELSSPHAETGGLFGGRVAISEQLVIISAFETVEGLTDAGRAYAFNATSGALIRTFTSPHPEANAQFAQAVAVDGKMVLIGAYAESHSGFPQAGNAYLFDLGTGKVLQVLSSPNPQNDGLFGVSVALNGQFEIVGAYGENAGGISSSGRAYIFNLTDGKLLHTLVGAKVEPIGLFGSSVALNGNLAIVGSFGETPEATYGGSSTVSIFDVQSGSLIRNLTSPAGQKTRSFGVGVASDGDLLAVGAFQETAHGFPKAGRVYVFKLFVRARMIALTFQIPNGVHRR